MPIVQARRLGPGEGLKGKSASPGVRPGLESSCVSLGMALGAARGLSFPVYSMSSAWQGPHLSQGPRAVGAPETAVE